jgi:4-cresol dehydrogenase (hydroxylating) flavoprotein subunit
MPIVADGVPDAAIQEWVAILGAAHVVAEPAALQRVETATFATTQRVPLVLRPADRAEVQACLRVASRHVVPIYPVSSGNNWGYGSSVPASDGNVLLDLGRMNRIVDFDEALGYVTVEPGVTQQDLYDFLQQRGSRLWMDATGAGPACSIIGNTMERGFGHTPYGDHYAHACAFEVVLADGTCLSTGLARFPDAAAGPCHRWAFGPILDGLFTQSNFGVVTRMTVWLMPAPERFEAFFFRCDSQHPLGAVIDALRPLRLNGTLRSASHIGNDYKVLNGLGQFPWAITGGRTPLRPEHMVDVRRRLRIGVWNGSGGLYGTRVQVAEAKRLLRRQLRGRVTHLQFVDDRKLYLAQRFAGAYRLVTGWDLSATLALLRPVYGLMQGIPTHETLASTYWRKRTPPPADPNPDRDRCGLLWCAPVAPLEGGHVERMAQLGIDVLLRHGFEPMLSLTLVSERALTGVVSICYDREVPGEDARAMACYQDLLATLSTHGYHSYRLGIQATQDDRPRDANDVMIAALKRALDPRGILAPGRYGIAAPPALSLTGDGAHSI